MAARTFADVSGLTRNASDLAAELIRDAIMDGRLEPGLRLKEEQLAQELGISRTPIREALQRLTTEGLVQARPNRGAFVRSYNATELNEMYELRAVLEGYAAGRAATSLTDEDLAELRASCERFEALSVATQVEEVVAENGRFHELIHASAAGELLMEMIRQVLELPLVYRTYVWYSPDQKRASEHAHRELLASLERRDVVQAERLMREHVLGARDVLMQHLRELEAAGD